MVFITIEALLPSRRGLDFFVVLFEAECVLDDIVLGVEARHNNQSGRGIIHMLVINTLLE